MPIDPESPLDKLWQEYSRVFHHFDDLTLARQAAIFKATKKMSYADCFAAALAKIKNAELVTGDPEFKVVESELKKIRWLK